MNEKEISLRNAISYCIENNDVNTATNRIMEFIRDEKEALTIPVVSNCTTCNDEINYKGVCEMCYTEVKLNDLD